MLMGVSIAGTLFHSLLLWAGFWVLTDLLPFGVSRGEKITYWVFAGLFAPYFLAQVSDKLKDLWRNAMIPGAFQSAMLKRKLETIQDSIRQNDA